MGRMLLLLCLIPLASPSSANTDAQQLVDDYRENDVARQGFMRSTISQQTFEDRGYNSDTSVMPIGRGGSAGFRSHFETKETIDCASVALDEQNYTEGSSLWSVATCSTTAEFIAVDVCPPSQGRHTCDPVSRFRINGSDSDFFDDGEGLYVQASLGGCTPNSAGVCSYELTITETQTFAAGAHEMESRGNAQVGSSRDYQNAQAIGNSPQYASGRATQYSQRAQVSDTYSTFSATGGDYQYVDSDGNLQTGRIEVESCETTCIAGQEAIDNNQTCDAELEHYMTGCFTIFPVHYKEYDIDRYDIEIVEEYPDRPSQTPTPPFGYSYCYLYDEEHPEIPEDGVPEDVYGEESTFYYACFQSNQQAIASGVDRESYFPDRQAITDFEQCRYETVEVRNHDPDVYFQHRIVEEAYICEYDRYTQCHVDGEDFPVDVHYGQNPPPNGRDEVQFNHPYQRLYLADGRTCGFLDNQSNTDLTNDNQTAIRLCDQMVGNFCVERHSMVECAIGPDPFAEVNECNTDPECSFMSHSCHETDAFGNCSTDRQTYHCGTIGTNSCTQYQTVCSGGPVDYQFESDVQPGESNWEESIEVMAMVDEMGSDIRDSCGTNSSCMENVELFGGVARECRKDAFQLSGQVAGVGALANCCDRELREADVALLFAQCDDDAIELASAKRQNRAKKMDGRRCSAKISFGFFDVCVAWTYIWCDFASTMAMEVNTQGREQINSALGSAYAPTAAFENIEIDYISQANNSHWGPIHQVGQMSFSVWEKDLRCADYNPIMARLGMSYWSSDCDPMGYFSIASCNSASNPNNPTQDRCGPLPESPQRMSGGSHWSVQHIPLDSVDPFVYDLSDHIQLTGLCPSTTDRCNLQVVNLREERDRSVIATLTLSFPLFDINTSVPELATSMTYGLRAYPIDPGSIQAGAPNPSTVGVQVTADYNVNEPHLTQWSSYTVLTDGTPVELTLGGDRVSLRVDCQGAMGTCEATLAYPATTERKWYHQYRATNYVSRRDHTDCSGFSMEEIAMLDFSEMDLASVTQNLGGAAELEATFESESQSSIPGIRTHATRLQGEYNSGQMTARTNQQGKPVWLSPDSGEPVWTTTLRVSLDFPKAYANTDGTFQNQTTRVNSVSVDWGDGESNVYSANSGATLTATHTYDTCYAGDLPNGCSDSYEMWHVVNVRVQLADGTSETVTLNALSTTEGRDSTTRAGGGRAGSVVYDPTQYPGGDVEQIPGN